MSVGLAHSLLVFYIIYTAHIIMVDVCYIVYNSYLFYDVSCVIIILSTLLGSMFFSIIL